MALEPGNPDVQYVGVVPAVVSMAGEALAVAVVGLCVQAHLDLPVLDEEKGMCFELRCSSGCHHKALLAYNITH